jgi:glycosyltransferase involved in cell wall biosynthesis
MRIFFVGDFKNNTGPGMANKAIRKGLLKYNTMLFSDAKYKLTRVLEIIKKTYISDCVCFCSSSRANIIAVKIAKIFKKKLFYVMHGYLTLENKINNPSISQEEIIKINSFEQYMFQNVDRVYCVSENFMNYMKNAVPEFKDKFDFNYNGLDLNKIMNATENYSTRKDRKQIASVGGGMNRKNNLAVCKAIDKLNREKQMNLKYIVIGLPYTEKEKICSYDFVTYYDGLPYERVLEILAETYLYIQNSTFETFGLAVIEALVSKCNLLISSTVGSIGVIKTINNDDLIFEQENIEEIASKIENVLKFENVHRLFSGISSKEIDFENAAVSLVDKISNRLV